MKPNPIALSLLAVLTVWGAAPVRADDKPVTLARAHKKGDVVRHKASSDIEVSGITVQLTGSSKTTIKEIKENGNVVYEEIAEGGKLTGAGADRDIPASEPVMVTRDKSGKLLDMKQPEVAINPQSPEISRLLAAIGTPILQAKPVKAGDSWETEIDNPAVKDKKLKVKTTFVGLEKVDGKELWKVKQIAVPAVDAANAKMEYETIVWMDPANGEEIKAETSIKDLPSTFGLLTFKTKSSKVMSEKAEKTDK